MTKRLVRWGPIQGLLAWLAALYIGLVANTTRWRVLCHPKARRILDERRPFIGCFWHGRLLLMSAAMPPRQRLHILVSEHRDGMLISRGIARLGISTVSGSSRRGGTGALIGMKRVLENGDAVAITPDGPRGPRMRMKPGALKIAQLSGAALLPVTAAITRRRQLGTWDRFWVPFPFARGVILWGEPMTVARGTDEAELEVRRREFEARMNDLTAEADRLCGLPALAPAERELPFEKEIPPSVDHARP